MSAKVKIIAAALAILAVLLLSGGVLWVTYASYRARPAASPDAAGEPAGSSATVQTAEIVPIKVGIILSHSTSSTPLAAPKADGTPSSIPNAQSPPWGYSHMATITNELHLGNFQLFPVIEPGTESDPALAKVLQRQFPGATLINGHDARELKTLDVLIAPQIWYASEPMVAAVYEAVNDGLGFLIRQSFGDWSPGFTAEVRRLHGLKEGTYGRCTPWNQAVPCEVVGAHTILGALSGKVSTDVDGIFPTGGFGIVSDDAVPLIRVKNIEAVYPGYNRNAHKDWIFYPLYTARLGRGRIICCNFDVHNQPSNDLQAATDGEFTLRCVQWLASEHAVAATEPAVALPMNTPPASQPSVFKAIR